jgi:predicted pyridoxine 5'-phosphate oxidase superfamily flavin-nucleotide-binding protein
MSDFYTSAQRGLQDQFGSRKLADLLTQVTVHREVQEPERAFIESRDMFFLASVDATGQPTCSYKGGAPGFVRVVDPRTLAFPIYDGNGMFLSAGNMQANAKIGMLFIDFEKPHRLRVHGAASLVSDPAILASCYGADMVVRVAIDVIFVNCPRYIHRYLRVSASRSVPQPGCEVPLATWKRIDVVQEALPARDADKVTHAGGIISQEQYQELHNEGKA